jgi:DNA polymerase (family 10)
VGGALAGKILEIVQTGDFKAHREILEEIPRSLLSILKIEGLGPKRVAMLYKELDIQNLEGLSQAVENGLVRTLHGFGPKIQEKIREGIRNLAQSHDRFPLDEVVPTASQLLIRMRKIPGVDKVEVAGSLRRWKETVKDLDILVTGDVQKTREVMDAFTSYEEVAEVVQRGETKSSVKLHMGIHVDLRFVDPECFGSSMQYFTGSKEHNIALRTFAKDKGFKTSEYGLFRIMGDREQRVAGKTEEEFYQALGMQYIEPELRENTGEIDRALSHTLPDLITLDDIQGDLHMHTTESDGINTLEEMIEMAVRLHYSYIAITEHSVSVKIAHGLEEDRLLRWLDVIRKTGARYPDIKVLAGVEVDIRKDGSLDFPDEVLEQCDVVLASIHSHFRMPSEEMTGRIITGISHPHVNILSHPTGRMIPEREPIQFDFAEVLAAALQNHVALEVNASPRRLDLKDNLIHTTVDKGGKVCIDTDAHSIAQLYNMEVGVRMARRGWCRKEDCLNTLNLSELRKFLSKHLD